jgi:hypothetical protein
MLVLVAMMMLIIIVMMTVIAMVMDREMTGIMKMIVMAMVDV